MIYSEDEYKYGMMDLNGKSIVDPIYSNISNEENGLYLVGKDYKFGLVDENGKVVVEAEYETLDKYKEFEAVDVYGLLKDDVPCYLIYDKKNNKLLSKEKVDISRTAKGEVFKVMEEGYVIYVTSDSKTILKDFSGKTLLTENNEFIDVSGEYFQFVSKTGTPYVVKFDGTRYLEENDFDDIYLPVSDGHVIFFKDGGYGIVSIDGRVKTHKLYENVTYIDSGVMNYFEDNGYGHVTIDGEEITKAGIYDYVYKFSEGLGLVIKAN